MSVLANPSVDFNTISVLDQVLSVRDQDIFQVPLVAFPNERYDDFELFDGKALNKFVDNAAWAHKQSGLHSGQIHPSRPIALLGPSSLDWMINAFAICRAGFTILCLSPRLSAEAVVKLLKETETSFLVYTDIPSIHAVVEQVTASDNIQTLKSLQRHVYDNDAHSCGPFEHSDLQAQALRTAIIAHSSGSTGLPKPLYISHQRFLREYPIGAGSRDMMTLPLYHAYALTIFPGRAYARKTVYFVNPSLPQTCAGLASAINAVKPDTISLVPYNLKLLADHESGIQALRACQEVIYTGSQCPDYLGKKLVEQGVALGSLFGSSECGAIGTSTGRSDHRMWDYLTLLPSMVGNIWPKKLADGTFEFVYLKDCPTKNATNSDDPPGSFHSKESFIPHEFLPNAWKFIGRMDDRITLLNGEKLLPLQSEGIIRQNPLVKEAVIFGERKPLPGLLLFRAPAAHALPDDQFMEKVLPEIMLANKKSESFAQLVKSMIIPLSDEVPIPYTDKGTFIRARVYQDFVHKIQAAYETPHMAKPCTKGRTKGEMETYLQQEIGKILGAEYLDLQDDFFSAGMNSLQAIEVRNRILNDLDMMAHSSQLGPNLVFEDGNVSQLAERLHRIHSTQAEDQSGSSLEQMQALISKYEMKRPFTPFLQYPSRKRKIVLLTGATGGLGGHILSLLATDPVVDHIYCLIRGAEPTERLLKTMQERQIALSQVMLKKVSIISCDLSTCDLGIGSSTYETLCNEITDIMHCAWPVNFQLALSSFEKSLAGLSNLLKLSIEVRHERPARFVFCSSIAVALDVEDQNEIDEAPMPQLKHALKSTGYGQSKLVSERILQFAVEHAKADVGIYRIGQIVGDTISGVWNDTEAVPLVLRSALTMGILPEMAMQCSWLPVDVCATSILEIEKVQSDRVWTTRWTCSEEKLHNLVYNICSPHILSWTEDLLPAVARCGIEFEIVPYTVWLQRLRNDADIRCHNMTQGPQREIIDAESPRQIRFIGSVSEKDPKQNPALKLVDFYTDTFLKAGLVGRTGSSISFKIDSGISHSPTLRDAPDLISSDLLHKMIRNWLPRWRSELLATSSTQQ